MPFGSLPLIVLLIIAVVYFHEHPDATSRARFLRRTAFGVMAFVTVFFGVFVVGETIGDPGGLAAVGWIAAWFVPLAGLVVLAWYRPAFALYVFVALTVAVLGLTVWAGVQSDSWRTFEDDHGPVRAIVVFVLTAAIAVYGLHRPREAGWLLVTLGVVPLALSGLGGDLALGSLAVAVTPALIAGVLYLIAANIDGGATPPPLTRPKDRLGVG
jgi:hypothetical protein